MKECTRCLFTEDVATILPDGECEYCKLHDKLERDSQDFTPVLWKIKQAGKGKQYDCVIGISGGVDSSTLLYAAVVKWKLKPLVIHFDNGYNKTAAINNMDSICRIFCIDRVIYNCNNADYRKLNEALLWARVPDADIPNDIAMTKLIYEAARMYKIKYILNGHDFRTEGSSPKKWSLIDSKYLRSIGEYYHKGYDFSSFPFFTIKDQLYYAFLGIKQVRPFHYSNVNRQELEDRMKVDIYFKEYGGKHGENYYTEFVGCYYLPKFHGIDKRITYLSARVRSGKITRDEASLEIKSTPPYDDNKIWYYTNQMPSIPKYFFDRGFIDGRVESYIRPREFFPRYDFKKYRAFWWVLMKLKVVPYTMYAKYCK